MIRAVAVSRTFGDRVLLEPSDWFLADTDRVGLVGPNGSGKSTWLKMLAGLESPDAGKIESPKGQRVGYLPQFGFEIGKGTVVEEARRAFGSILELQGERDRLEHDLRDPVLSPERAETLLSRHDRLEQEIRRLDGYEIERRVDRVLRGLGFQAADFNRRVEALSGGWQVRLSLARLLLENPDVLLLDEPTNHLDIEAREWLEGFLREYPGSFVLVSHDRYFLDVTVTRITDIMNHRLVDYTGNYSRYLIEREARYEHARKAYERQQEEIRRIEVFIERFRYKNTKASQVQSRVKMLEKLPRLDPPEAPSRSIHFRFPQPDRTGRITVDLKGIHKAYGEVEVFRRGDLQLERGQKVALVGPNGAGKSTLMRILAGTETFDSGERIEGLRVTIDHFAQDQADRMTPVHTIMQQAMNRAPNSFVPQVRGLLGAFLFTGDAVEKKIGVLSGGERNRLALALMLMKPSSLLLLDEPTNHLDMAAKDVLLEALKGFEGTVVFVSHDRHFLAGLANRVIEVGGGGLREYPGDYEGFLWKKRQEEEKAAADDARTAAGAISGGRPGSGGRPLTEDARKGDGALPSAGLSEAPEGGGRRNKASRRAVRDLETKITTLEERKEKLEALLAREDLYRDPEKSSFYLSEYKTVTLELEQAMERWAESAGTLDDA